MAALVTAPRQVIPNTTYLVTRRTAQRQFLLKPSELTTAIFGYLLAVAAARHRIEVHAYVVMSNHYHLVVTDRLGQLPAFGQFLASLVARALNASYGRWEAFWAPASYSAVTLVSNEDIIEKAAYTLANPVAAGLVSTGRAWPGLWSDPADVGRAGRSFKRPGQFFDLNGQMPERSTLRLTPPPGFTAEEYRSAITSRLGEIDKKAARELVAAGRKFMGARRVLAQRHTDNPASGEPRRELNPRVAARDKWKRVEALGRLKAFLRDYREALAKLRQGVAGVVFPPGTYRLRVLLGVPCAAAG